jgi:hypothetical protein
MIKLIFFILDTAKILQLRNVHKKQQDYRMVVIHLWVCKVIHMQHIKISVIKNVFLNNNSK